MVKDPTKTGFAAGNPTYEIPGIVTKVAKQSGKNISLVTIRLTEEFNFEAFNEKGFEEGTHVEVHAEVKEVKKRARAAGERT